MNDDKQRVCKKDTCAGCMLCIDTCPVCAISLKDSIDAYNAIIDLNRCIKCGKCHTLCPQNVQPKFLKPKEWHQGWGLDPEMRERCASGGIATEIASKFIKNGGEVCTCNFDCGNFGFRFFNKADDLFSASGSKYVKSNPHGIYKDLSNKLANGKKILMIGLPCQIAAAKKFIDSSRDKYFYTIDLVCHGTPSPNLLRLFLEGKHVTMEDIKTIRFREKNLKKDVNQERIQDDYMHAFDRGMSYTRNCYYCHYARPERISDVTLGDSWGSELPETEKGISLVLCQTMKGRELLNIADAEFFPVDIERAVNHNMNLKGPCVMPDSGKRFLSEIKKGKSFHKAMLRADPNWVIKNKIKNTFPLIFRIKRKLRGGESIQYSSVSHIYNISYSDKLNE